MLGRYPDAQLRAQFYPLRGLCYPPAGRLPRLCKPNARARKSFSFPCKFCPKTPEFGFSDSCGRFLRKSLIISKNTSFSPFLTCSASFQFLPSSLHPGDYIPPSGCGKSALSHPERAGGANARAKTKTVRPQMRTVLYSMTSVKPAARADQTPSAIGSK